MPPTRAVIQTRLPPELRDEIDAHVTQRRRRTGENLSISEWMREAAVEKLARELPTIAPPAPELEGDETEPPLPFPAGPPAP
jgi:hypothetical protein